MNSTELYREIRALPPAERLHLAHQILHDLVETEDGRTRSPLGKTMRALRAEIDEGAWSALYSTTSRPFDPPESGKIAVKVINHYGDEVLKVYEVETRIPASKSSRH